MSHLSCCVIGTVVSYKYLTLFMSQELFDPNLGGSASELISLSREHVAVKLLYSRSHIINI